MLILALDLGKFKTMCCYFDTQTRKAEFLVAATERDYLSKIFNSRKVDLVVMEACGPSGWIHDLACSLGLQCLVCSTNEDAWKWSNVKRKTDKDDALKLARMAAMRELKAVHMPSEQQRELRSLVKYRKILDQRICKMKCAIRAWFVNHGITIDSGDKAWHTGRARIDSFRKPLEQCEDHELWRAELDIELTQLDAISAQLDKVVKKLEAIGKNDPRIQRVMSIPGVGPRTAEILVACIDDPHRFSSGREVSAYLGLVPRQYQSGQTDRNGRITKRGNPLARTILVECAWASLRYNPWAKAIYERVQGGQRTRKKKAAVALARKLAVIAWALLRDERDWDPKRMVEVTESFGRMPPALKTKLSNMKPKENSDQRKSRLRREARAQREAAARENPQAKSASTRKASAKSRKRPAANTGANNKQSSNKQSSNKRSSNKQSSSKSAGKKSGITNTSTREGTGRRTKRARKPGSAA